MTIDIKGGDSDASSPSVFSATVTLDDGQSITLLGYNETLLEQAMSAGLPVVAQRDSRTYRGIMESQRQDAWWMTQRSLNGFGRIVGVEWQRTEQLHNNGTLLWI